MTITELLRATAEAGLHVRLVDGAVRVSGITTQHALLMDTLKANKPALVAALVAVRTEQTRIAALLRSLRRQRTEAAPAGVTLALNAAGKLVALPRRKLVYPEQQAEIVALLEPLGTYLLTRELFGPSEVNWRADAMRRQQRAWQGEGGASGEAPCLLARPLREGEWPRLDRCLSCGDALAHDPHWDGTTSAAEPGYGRDLRCHDCREAARRVQAETSGLEGWCWCGQPVHRYTLAGDPLCALHDETACCPRCQVRPVARDRWCPDGAGKPLYRVCGVCALPSVAVPVREGAVA